MCSETSIEQKIITEKQLHFILQKLYEEKLISMLEYTKALHAISRFIP